MKKTLRRLKKMSLSTIMINNTFGMQEFKNNDSNVYFTQDIEKLND